MTVIAVTSLLLEARIATGPGVSVICGHASQLVSCLQAAIKRGASGVISFGVAGGLAPHLAPGDWVIGSGVRTGHTSAIPRIDGGHLACFKRFPVLFTEKSPERMLPLLTPRKRFDYIRSRAQWRSTWSPMSRPRWPPCTIFHLPFVARLLTRRAGTCRRLP